MLELLDRRTLCSKHFDIGSGKRRAVIGSGLLHYKNDESSLTEINLSQIEENSEYIAYREIADNCEARYYKNSVKLRVYKPNYSVNHYVSDWTEDDYWLETSYGPGSLETQNENCISYLTEDNVPITFYVQRTSMPEQILRVKKTTPRPKAQWICSPNLTRRRASDFLTWEWVNSAGDIIFSKSRPLAWSQADELNIKLGVNTVDDNGFVTNVFDLEGLKYPIIEDPTTVFTTANDFDSRRDDELTWSEARDASDGNNGGSTTPQIIWSILDSGFYSNSRLGIPFVTSSIGPNKTVTAGFISLFNTFVENFDSTTINVCQGTYPVPAPTQARYSQLTFVSGGSLPVASITNGAYFNIPLDATGFSFINMTGTTKLMIITGLDLSNTPPTDYTRITVRMSDSVTPPLLTLTYEDSSSPEPTPSPLPGVSPSIPSTTIKHALNSARYKGSTVLDTTNETGKDRESAISTLRDTILSVMTATSRANVHVNTSAGRKLNAIAALNPNTATAADIINAARNA